MFNLDLLVELPDIPAKSTEDGRFYNTPSGWYPSVTTVLGKMSDKSWVEPWIEKVGVEEASRKTARGQARGSALHKLCEAYLKNEPVNGMPLNVETFNKVKPTLDRYVTDILGIEIALYSDFLKVAGRADLVARYYGRNSIIDFKTASWKKTRDDILDYFAQEAIYSVCFEERTNIPIPYLVTIIAVDDEPFPQVFIEKRDDHIETAMQKIIDYYKLL